MASIWFDAGLSDRIIHLRIAFGICNRQNASEASSKTVPIVRISKIAPKGQESEQRLLCTCLFAHICMYMLTDCVTTAARRSVSSNCTVMKYVLSLEVIVRRRCEAGLGHDDNSGALLEGRDAGVAERVVLGLADADAGGGLGLALGAVVRTMAESLHGRRGVAQHETWRADNPWSYNAA